MASVSVLPGVGKRVSGSGPEACEAGRSGQNGSVPVNRRHLDRITTVALAAVVLAACTVNPEPSLLPVPDCFHLDVSVDGPPMTVDAIRRAPQIAVATVRDVEASIFNTPDQEMPSVDPRDHSGVHPLIVTPHSLLVVESIKGIGDGDVVRAVTPGGTVGCSAYNVSPNIPIRQGGTYLFFLYPGRDIEGGLHPEIPSIAVAWPIDAQDNVRTETDGVLTLGAIKALVGSGN